MEISIEEGMTLIRVEHEGLRTTLVHDGKPNSMIDLQVVGANGVVALSSIPAAAVSSLVEAFRVMQARRPKAAPVAGGFSGHLDAAARFADHTDPFRRRTGAVPHVQEEGAFFDASEGFAPHVHVPDNGYYPRDPNVRQHGDVDFFTE